MPINERLNEIKTALLDARSHPHYNIGSPQAIDHLLVHVVALIEALQDERRAALGDRPHD